MKKKLQHLDLFSGIGGFSLGLEEIGLVETVAFCDFDKYCQEVLKKHWPNVPIFSDIKELTYEKLKANGINKIDIITGGYPCQPFSVAGSQKGEQDPRHVWPEYFRLVKELKPTWVIGENVSGHIKLGLDTVLENLESEGYSTRTFSISASSVGANHQRERVWIIAHSDSNRAKWNQSEDRQGSRTEQNSEDVANSNNAGDRTSEYETNKNREKTDERWQEQSQFEFSGQSENVANSDDKRIWSRIGGSDHDNEKKSGGWSFDRGRSNGNDEWSDSSTTKNETMDVANSNGSEQTERRQHSNVEEESHVGGDLERGSRTDGGKGRVRTTRQSPENDVANTNSKRGRLWETGSEDAKNVGQSPRSQETLEWWNTEPDVGRVAHGVSKRVDRLKSLGNSLVPQIPFLIGSCIKEIEDI